MHTCIYCGSPCEVTLAASSEGCTNNTCRAFKKAEVALAFDSSDSVSPESREKFIKNLENVSWPKTTVPLKVEPNLDLKWTCLSPYHEEPCGNCTDCVQKGREKAKTFSFSEALYSGNVRSGRFSASRPNFSAIPRFEDGRDARDPVYIVEELLGPLDLGPGKQDLHQAAAAKLFATPYGQVTHDQRNKAKQYLYVHLYGGTTPLISHLELMEKMQKELGYTPEEAREKLAGMAQTVGRILRKGATLDSLKLAEMHADEATKEEHSMPLLLGEILTHRVQGIQAKVIKLPQGEPGSKNRRQYELAIVGAVGTRCAGVSTYGTTGHLLKQWKRDFDSGVLLKHRQADEFEKNLRWWPNTMRVVVDPAKYDLKEGADLLGVLSLVQVPQRGKGLIAVYDYVTVMSPKTGRARLTVGRVDGSKYAMVMDAPCRYVTDNFAVTLTHTDKSSIDEISEVHLPAVALEMERHLEKERTPRNMTEAESAWMAAMRKNIW